MTAHGGMCHSNKMFHWYTSVHRTISPCGTAEQREFETGLKKRKREFGETLERYEAEVDKYAQRSELSRRDELAAQVSELSQKLKEVSRLPLVKASHLSC